MAVSAASSRANRPSHVTKGGDGANAEQRQQRVGLRAVEGQGEPVAAVSASCWPATRSTVSCERGQRPPVEPGLPTERGLLFAERGMKTLGHRRPRDVGLAASRVASWPRSGAADGIEDNLALERLPRGKRRADGPTETGTKSIRSATFGASCAGAALSSHVSRRRSLSGCTSLAVAATIQSSPGAVPRHPPTAPRASPSSRRPGGRRP